jgi:uncharacterized membrane protein YbhN (UPF0104 family)
VVLTRARLASRWSWLRATVVLLGLVVLSFWAWRQRPAALPDGWHALLLPGVFLALCSLFAYSVRFRYVMRLLDLDVHRIESLRIVSFAVFCQCFVPMGGGAELAKFFKLRGLAPQRRALISAAGVALEHLIGLAILVLTASVLFGVLRPIAIDLAPVTLAVGAVAILALAATVLLRRQNLHARQLIVHLQTHRRDALLALSWSLLMHVLLAAAVFVGSLGWAIPIGYGQILFVLSAAGVLQAVPANLLGIGMADAAGTGLYVALGLSLSNAVLLASLLIGYRLLIALLGGLWELGATRRVIAGET